MASPSNPYVDKLPLGDFKFDRVLSHDPRDKKVAVLGSFKGSDEPAVLLLSRRHFDLERISSLLAATSTSLDFSNDIYAKYTGTAEGSHALYTLDTIWPATEKHIKKHSAQARHLVHETPELYASVVKPYLESLPPSRIQWVYNILTKQAEVERLIFEDADPDTGFMLHPDLKWDQVQHEQLYCVALCMRRDVGSLRDLRAEHLPLLENIQRQACQVIEKRYAIPASQLRLFVHYQPSYYHFHVHITHIEYEGPGLMAGKAVLLDDILDNLRTFGPDYYQRRMLSYVLAEGDELWPLVSAWQQQQRQQ